MRCVAIAAMVALAGAGLAAQSKDDPGLTKVRAAYQAAVGAQNGPAIAKLYAPDGVEMPPNAPAAAGPAAIEAFHKAFGQQWMMHGITITALNAKIIGDTAFEVGTYKQQLMSQKDGSMVDDKGKYVVLLKKNAAGAWLITHAIYNSDNPPPAGPAKK